MKFVILLLAFTIGCGAEVSDMENAGRNLSRSNPDNWAVTWDEYPGSGKTIVLMGDSRVDLMPVRTIFPTERVINIALSGTTSANTFTRTSFIGQFNPDVVFVSVGGNDIIHFLPLDLYQERIGMIIDSIKSSCPMAEIYVTGVVPSRRSSTLWDSIEFMNSGLDLVIAAHGATYIDTSEMEDVDGGLRVDYSVDDVHYSPAGYVKFEEIIRRYF